MSTDAAPRSTRLLRRGRYRGVLLAGGLALPLALAGCTAGGTNTASASTSSASAPSSGGGGSGTAAALQNDYQRVIDQVLPSVVEITTPVGLGSGIVFDGKGDIVTNDHVVGNSTKFTVTFSGSPTPHAATLVGAFPPDDLAVIRVSGLPKNLSPARFADSSSVHVGTIVLAMGNPLGLESSVTNGIVSAVGRTVSEPQSQDSPGATLPDAIQTSAAINPGNSGGALVDLQGEVVGIPTLAATDQQLGGGAAPGIGFAIPSNVVKDIAGQLASSGKVTDSHRAYLGIRATTVTDPSGRPAGIGVVAVQKGGPAAAAGIQAGDVITSVAGHQVADDQQLTSVLANLKVGQSVAVTLQRGGNRQTVHVTLGELPAG